MPPGVLVFSAIKAINLHRYFWVKIYVTVILGVKICPKTFRPKLSFIESIPDPQAPGKQASPTFLHSLPLKPGANVMIFKN
jgi:hypothetical protein